MTLELRYFFLHMEVKLRTCAPALLQISSIVYRHTFYLFVCVRVPSAVRLLYYLFFFIVPHCCFDSVVCASVFVSYYPGVVGKVPGR
jgi:hypothetical protein